MTINNINEKELATKYPHVEAQNKRITICARTKRNKEARDRIALMREAKELGCEIEDLL